MIFILCSSGLACSPKPVTPLNITPILDITQEEAKLVKTQQTKIISSHYSFIQENTLCTVSNQGVFFITDLSSGERKVYVYPEWAGFIEFYPNDMSFFGQKLLIDCFYKRYQTSINLIDLTNKTKKNRTEYFMDLKYIGNQKIYYVLYSPYDSSYDFIKALDFNLKDCWQFPPNDKFPLLNKTVWEYKEVCHIIGIKKDTAETLLHVCLDPNTGKELFREVLQENTKNGVEVVQKGYQIWIQSLDEKGLYITSYRLNADHALHQQWARYYTDKPLTIENFLQDGDKDGLQYVDNRGKPYLIMPISYNKQNSDQYKYESELICINPEDGSRFWTSKKFLCSSLRLYPTNQHIIIDLGINTQIIGMKPKHDFLCLHRETGQGNWKKTFQDECLKESHRRKLQISCDQESLLVWDYKENSLTKILAQNGKTATYQFNKQALCFVQFLPTDQHTYFEFIERDKVNSTLLRSIVYKVE
ncbi:hypothetical protein LLG10_00595 [bacterium]|nr:hypothetical protein [bacterium]